MQKLPNRTEKRCLARREIDRHIVVKDALLDAEVGRVVNINEKGFMLIGSGQIRENCLYQLCLHLDEPVGPSEYISVGAECLWVKETDSGTQYWAGFNIIDVSEQDYAIIKSL